MMRLHTARQLATLAALYKKNCGGYALSHELVDILWKHPQIWTTKQQAWHTVNRAAKLGLLIKVGMHLKRCKYVLNTAFDLVNLTALSEAQVRDVAIVDFIKKATVDVTASTLKHRLMPTPMFKDMKMGAFTTRYHLLAKRGVLEVCPSGVKSAVYYTVANESLLQRQEPVTPYDLVAAKAHAERLGGVSGLIRKAWLPVGVSA